MVAGRRYSKAGGIMVYSIREAATRKQRRLRYHKGIGSENPGWVLLSPGPAPGSVFCALTPVLDGLANRLRCEIAAPHLVLRYAAQCVGHLLLFDLIGLLDGLAQDHLGGYG